MGKVSRNRPKLPRRLLNVRGLTSNLEVFIGSYCKQEDEYVKMLAGIYMTVRCCTTLSKEYKHYVSTCNFHSLGRILWVIELDSLQSLLMSINKLCCLFVKYTDILIIN